MGAGGAGEDRLWPSLCAAATATVAAADAGRLGVLHRRRLLGVQRHVRERRVRVLTLGLQATEAMASLYRYADLDATCNVLMRQVST